MGQTLNFPSPIPLLAGMQDRAMSPEGPFFFKREVHANTDGHSQAMHGDLETTCIQD